MVLNQGESMVTFADAHCHLHEPWFPDSEIPTVLNRARNENVKLIVSCASDPRNYDQVRKSAMHNEIYTTIGMQPTEVPKYRNIDFHDLLSKQLDSPYGNRIVAIGEVGLDYYWVKEEKEQNLQKKYFEHIIAVANSINLPLVIHCRKAENDTIDVLATHAEVPVLLHSFDGTADEAKKAVDLGYIATIPTNLTRRKKRRKTAKRFGIDNIMLETDSPFCSPFDNDPRNEPKNIPVSAKRLAQDFEVELEELAKKTFQLTRRFYAI